MSNLVEILVQQLQSVADWIVGLLKERIEGFLSGDDFFAFLSLGNDPSGTIALVLGGAFVLTALLFFWYLFALIRSDPEDPKGALVKRLLGSFLIGAGILILGPQILNFLSSQVKLF